MRVNAVQLFLYPVKACAGVAVQRLAFDAAGAIVGDREWAVVDEEGTVTWQGAVPRLALVRPHPVPGGLVLEAPGLPKLYVDAAESRDGEVRIWNEARRAHDVFAASLAHGDATAWLAQATGERLRLVRLGAAAMRREGVNPVHLLSARSVAVLNERLQRAGVAPAAIGRFRPNVVIDGDELQPFDEAFVRGLRWEGGTALHLEQPCVRCVVVNVDPETGQSAAEPLAMLAMLGAERQAGAPVSFGVYGRAAGRGALAVGESALAELAF